MDAELVPKANQNGFLFFSSGSWLSQFFPCRFVSEGVKFTSSEQYMMYHKALLFGDEIRQALILKERRPSAIKRLGRQVSNFKDGTWKNHCRAIVYRGNLAKFSQNPGLWRQLLATGDRDIVEASPYDTIWGIGLRVGDVRCADEATWRGKNWLGKALVNVRSCLRARPSDEIATTELQDAD
jgi:hypothetical protein